MSAPSLRGVYVLIVEDNFVVADALRFMLTGFDAIVSAIVPSLAHASAALAVDRVDVAILDINLNGTSVVPLADDLRIQGIPFVFVSGYGDEELLPEQLRDRPRFDKPVEAERLVARLIEIALRP